MKSKEKYSLWDVDYRDFTIYCESLHTNWWMVEIEGNELYFTTIKEAKEVIGNYHAIVNMNHEQLVRTAYNLGRSNMDIALNESEEETMRISQESTDDNLRWFLLDNVGAITREMMEEGR